MMLPVLFRPLSSRAAPTMNVTVTNLFAENSNETTETINEAINAAEDNTSYVTSYSSM